MAQWWTTRVLPIISIDLRSLALFRILLGGLLIADLVIRGSDLSVWMTDAGVFPRDFIIDWNGDNRWSLYFISGSWLWALLLHLTAAGAALALLLGYRTRLVTIISFIFLVSLHNRAPLVLQGGDNLLLLMVFWSIFLPLGARFSMDAARVHPDQQQAFNAQPNAYCSVATVAILFQAMAVYFFSAFLKSGSEWYEDGTAIYYALNLDEVATGLAHYWRNEHWLTVPLTRFVWWLELLGPILIFTPLLRVPVRLLMMFLFIAMEVGFILNLHIGLFPFISITSILLFTPTETWDALARRFWPAAGDGLTMYYDQDCGFCLKMCWLLKTFLGLKAAQIIPAQTNAEMAEILEREFSWVVVTPSGERLIKWPAMVAVFAASPSGRFLAPMLSWPQRLGNRLYDSVANNRGAFGEWFAALLPWHTTVKMPGWPSHAVAGFFLAYLLLWNLSTIPNWQLPFQEGVEDKPYQVKFPKTWQEVKRLLRLDQKWSMFAPYPNKSDSFLVVPGVLSSGKLVDVYDLTEGAPSFEKPDVLFDTKFKNYRWRKYLSRVGIKRYRAYRTHYGSYLCQSWNAAHGKTDPLTDFNIYRMVERTKPPGVESQVTRTKVWRHYCIKDDGDKVEPALKAAGHW